jgi:pimeloyl-ACP methyl ester carboxylesterase
MAFVETADGTQLYLKDWGTGIPVVMLHGWPLSADSWDDVSNTLAESGFRAVSYDRRGFGRSDQPWQGYDYDTLADDLAAVIAYCDAPAVHLIGFSMGGGEVARYMSRHAGRKVAKAVLVSSIVPYMLKTADNPAGTAAEVFDGMAQDMKADRAKFFAGFFRDFFGVGAMSHPTSQETIDWASRIAMQASLKATLACASAFSTTDFRADLPAFKVPTLIVHGTADKTVPIDASSRAAAIGIANSQLIEYENAPHGLFATHKQKFAKDLLKFLLRDAHRAPRQQPVGIVPPADTASTASHAARIALR